MEKSNGSPDDNYKYCSKDKNFECNGWEAKRKPVRFGGYTSVEEQVLNEPMKVEIQMVLNDEAKEWVKEHEGIDETLDESWSTDALDGYDSD